MFKRLPTLLCIVAAFVLSLLLLAIFVAANSTCSASCAFPSGRTVNVSCKSWGLGMSNTKDTARVDASGHTIVVRPQVIEVDGQKFTRLDGDLKSIEIHVTRGQITFVADGKPLPTWRR